MDMAGEEEEVAFSQILFEKKPTTFRGNRFIISSVFSFIP